MTRDPGRRGETASPRPPLLRLDLDPRSGEARVEGTIAMPGSYGALSVHAMKLGEHSPHDFWMADPTPDDAMAFRVVNPHQAPPDYAARLRTQCAPGCRGY